MLLKKIFKNPFISIILLVLILILGIGRNYVWLTFRTGTGKIIIQKFSFLSSTIFGYGLYFPLFVIIITVSLFVLSILKLLIPSLKIRSSFFIILTIINIICIILPIFIGIQMINTGIIFILALMIINLIFSLYRNQII